MHILLLLTNSECFLSIDFKSSSWEVSKYYIPSCDHGSLQLSFSLNICELPSRLGKDSEVVSCCLLYSFKSTIVVLFCYLTQKLEVTRYIH